MKTYLFEFTFKKDTINSYLSRWMRDTKTDYFYKNQGLYADIYGCGEYYLISPEHVVGSVYEVYADTEIALKNESLNRLYPLVSKAISVQMPFRKLKVTFPDGEELFTEIRSCARDAKAFYLGNPFKKDNNIMYADSVEILA